jgi:hypothetical protein
MFILHQSFKETPMHPIPLSAQRTYFAYVVWQDNFFIPEEFKFSYLPHHYLHAYRKIQANSLYRP